MKQSYYTFNDDAFQLRAYFKYEISPPQKEECHGFHDVGGCIYVALTSLCITINNRDLDILPLLNKSEKEKIISLLDLTETI